MATYNNLYPIYISYLYNNLQQNHETESASTRSNRLRAVSSAHSLL